MIDRAKDYYQRVSLWAARHLAILFAVSFGLLFMAVVLIRVEAHERSAVDRARTAQLAWDNAEKDHQVCVLVTSAGRDAVRRTFSDVFDSFVQFANPANRAEVERIIATEKAVADKGLHPIDCEDVYPSPKGPRPSIP